MSRRYESQLSKEDALEASRLQNAAVLRLWDAMGRLDLDLAAEHLAEVRSVAYQYMSEPARLSSEIIYVQCAAALAETYIEAGENELGFELAVSAWEELLQYQERWRRTDLPSEGSKARLALVSTMAQIKWSCPKYREHWPAFAFLYQQFVQAAERILAYEERKAASAMMPDLPPETLDLMQVTGTALAKLGFRLDSPELQDLIAFLNNRLQLKLTLERQAFKTPQKEQAENDRYWDFEIAKMIVSGVGGIADYEFCSGHRRRILFARLGYSEAVERSWARERLHFMRGLELAPVAGGGHNEEARFVARDRLDSGALKLEVREPH